MDLIQIPGQDSGGTVKALAGVTSATSASINVSQKRPEQRDNRGRSLQIKVTKITPLTGATMNVWGRIDPSDANAWVPLFDLNRALEIQSFAIPSAGTVPLRYVFVFGADYREIYVETMADSGTMDIDVVLGS